jgi:hypothetical protein
LFGLLGELFLELVVFVGVEPKAVAEQKGVAVIGAAVVGPKAVVEPKVKVVISAAVFHL